MVLSILCWGAGAWPKLSQQEWKLFSVATWDLYRLLMPQTYVNGAKVIHTHLDILVTLRLPHPEDLLQEARARHLLAMVNHAPSEVWAILHQDANSLEAYQGAINWIWTACERDKDLAPPQSWAFWLHLARDRPSYWRRVCGHAGKRWRNFKVLWGHVDVWRADLYHHLWQEHMWDTPMPSTAHRCLLCRVDFSQARAWFLHAHCKHAYRSVAGRAVQGQFCPQCARLYPTSLSLQHHLRYNDSCRACFWNRRGTDITAPTTISHVHQQCPWLPTDDDNDSGPRHRADPFDPDFIALLDDLRQTLSRFVPPEDEKQLTQALVDEIWAILCTPIPYMTIVAAFETWKSDLRDSEDPHLLSALNSLGHRLTAPYDDKGHEHTLRPPAPGNWTTLKWSDKACTPANRSYLPQEIVFLHFYSGFRRDGDVQMCLEDLRLPPDCVLSVASVDVAVNATTCNMMNEDAQRRWIKFIADGHASGIGHGPPCETWSIARYQRVKELRKGGPRPLRTATLPWGRHDLVAAEAEQVHTGNCLMGFSVRATILQGIRGGFAYMEHPADPHAFANTPQEAVTIWRTDIIRKCLELPMFSLITVSQGYYGGLSAKPTGLLLTGLKGDKAEQLAASMRTTPMPSTSSIGRKDGKWKTSDLKTYPPDFCRLLSAFFAEWVDRHQYLPRCSIETHVQWIQDLCVKLAESPEASSAQPDFHKAEGALNSSNLFC